LEALAWAIEEAARRKTTVDMVTVWEEPLHGRGPDGGDPVPVLCEMARHADLLVVGPEVWMRSEAPCSAR
jgi:hypothetical protein